MEKIYSCNICGDKIEKTDLSKAVGIHFYDLKKFTIGGYASTDNVHICEGCLKQLKYHLKGLDIKE